jgi:uncharacterized protein YndB with AHSA1/START domain
MPDITHLLSLHASPERVHQALSAEEGIRSWWTRDADLDSKISGMGQFRFYGGQGRYQRASRRVHAAGPGGLEEAVVISGRGEINIMSLYLSDRLTGATSTLLAELSGRVA